MAGPLALPFRFCASDGGTCLVHKTKAGVGGLLGLTVSEEVVMCHADPLIRVGKVSVGLELALIENRQSLQFFPTGSLCSTSRSIRLFGGFPFKFDFFDDLKGN